MYVNNISYASSNRTKDLLPEYYPLRVIRLAIQFLGVRRPAFGKFLKLIKANYINAIALALLMLII